MKTIWMAFISLILLSACQNEANGLLELKLCGSIKSTRVAGSTLQNKYIVSGLQVGVTVEGASTTYNNIPWISMGQGTLNNQNRPIYYKPGQQLTICAYQPYQAEPLSLFQVSQSQDDNQGYLTSDLLYAETTASAANTQVDLEFHHVLSQLVVELETLDGTNLSDADVTICGTKLSAWISKDMVSPEDNAQSGDIHAGTGPTTSVILIPQTVPAQTQFIKVEVEQQTLYYTLPEDYELSSGSSYTLKLMVNLHSNTLEKFTSTTGVW